MSDARSTYNRLDRWFRGLSPVKHGAAMTIVFLFSWIAVSLFFGGGTETLIAGVLGLVAFGGTAAILQKWGPVW